jgi:hypothetical protein
MDRQGTGLRVSSDGAGPLSDRRPPRHIPNQAKSSESAPSMVVAGLAPVKRTTCRCSSACERLLVFLAHQRMLNRVSGRSPEHHRGVRQVVGSRPCARSTASRYSTRPCERPVSMPGAYILYQSDDALRPASRPRTLPYGFDRRLWPRNHFSWSLQGISKPLQKFQQCSHVLFVHLVFC